MDDYIAANRALWDVWAELHTGPTADPKIYNSAKFRAGGVSLNSLEREELGDVAGKSLLHLQCHFGMDTLSWARLGANVTGLDFSPNAITQAEKLRDETGLQGNFVCSSVYDAPDALQGQFDIVYTSYGVIGWLPDLTKWAQFIAHFLRPGGTFYMAEFHPFAYVFDNSGAAENLTFRYPYFHDGAVIAETSQGSYGSSGGHRVLPEYGWDHSIGELVTALSAAGLRLEFLHEFPFNIIRWFPFMERRADGYWHLTQNEKMIPLLYSLKATAPK